MDKESYERHGLEHNLPLVEEKGWSVHVHCGGNVPKTKMVMLHPTSWITKLNYLNRNSKINELLMLNDLGQFPDSCIHTEFSDAFV